MAKITDFMFYIPKDKFNFINFIKLVRTKYKEYNEIIYSVSEGPSEYCLKFITNDMLNYSCSFKYNGILCSVELGQSRHIYTLDFRYTIKSKNPNLHLNNYKRTQLLIEVTNKFNLLGEYTSINNLNIEYKNLDSYFNIRNNIEEFLEDDKNKILLSYCDNKISYSSFTKIFSYYNKFNLNKDIQKEDIDNFIDFINEAYDPSDGMCTIKYSNISIKLKNGISIFISGQQIFSTANINIYKYIDIDKYQNELKFIIKILSNINIYNKLILSKQKYQLVNF